MDKKSIAEHETLRMTTQMCIGYTMIPWNESDAQSIHWLTMQTCECYGFTTLSLERCFKNLDGRKTMNSGRNSLDMCLTVMSMKNGRLLNGSWNTACMDLCALSHPVCWYFDQSSIHAPSVVANHCVNYQGASLCHSTWTSRTRKKYSLWILISNYIIHH